jgi:hypothetical protein
VLRTIVEGGSSEPTEEPAPLEASHVPRPSPTDDGLQSGQSTDARIILDVAEDGLRLAARTARLSEEDQARLRHQIASLLASHGLSAAEIRLNGDIGKDSRSIQEGRS